MSRDHLSGIIMVRATAVRFPGVTESIRTRVVPGEPAGLHVEMDELPYRPFPGTWIGVRAGMRDHDGNFAMTPVRVLARTKHGRLLPVSPGGFAEEPGKPREFAKEVEATLFGGGLFVYETGPGPGRQEIEFSVVDNPSMRQTLTVEVKSPPRDAPSFNLLADRVVANELHIRDMFTRYRQTYTEDGQTEILEEKSWRKGNRYRTEAGGRVFLGEMDPILVRSSGIENRLVGVPRPGVFAFQRHGYGIEEVWIDAEKGVLVEAIDLEPAVRAESIFRSYGEFRFFNEHNLWLSMRREMRVTGALVIHETLEFRIKEGISDEKFEQETVR